MPNKKSKQRKRKRRNANYWLSVHGRTRKQYRKQKSRERYNEPVIVEY